MAEISIVTAVIKSGRMAASFIIGIMLMFSICCSVSAADTYEQRFDIPYLVKHNRGSTYLTDPNVWVYTPRAKKRFGMPDKWADDGLKGAELVALRLAPVGRMRCHQKDNKVSCVPSYEWVIELYINSDAPLGITGNRKLDMKPWRSSLAMLGRRYPPLKAKWEKSFTLKGAVMLVGAQGKQQRHGFEVISYNRTLKKNMIQVRALVMGTAPLFNSALAKEVRFTDSSGKVLHTVSIPRAFWVRVKEYRSKVTAIDERSWLGGEEQDNNIWVYTTEFAKKYGMPASGINDELEGTLAVAFRVQPYAYQTCGFFGNPNACVDGNDQIFDLYLPITARLSYMNNNVIDYFKPGSNYLLSEQDKNMRLPREWPRVLKHVYYGQYTRKSLRGSQRRMGSGTGRILGSVRPRAWGAKFGFISAMSLSSISDVRKNYILFTNLLLHGDSAKRLNYKTHECTMPKAFIQEVVKHIKKYECEQGSLWTLVQRKYKGRLGKPKRGCK